VEIKNLTIEHTKEPSLLYNFIWHKMAIYVEDFYDDNQVVAMVFVGEKGYNFSSDSARNVLLKVEKWIAEEQT